MKKYICTVCEYIYDPEQGDPDGNYSADYKCDIFDAKIGSYV